MTLDHLKFHARPAMHNATMLLALTGWMDGGMVSTGTVRRMMENRQTVRLAHIQPDPFYIYNFPGSMEVAALFRPEVKIVEGMISEMDLPANEFFCDEAANLVFFIGKEPNLRWGEFAQTIFHVANESAVTRIIFIGSFGGAVPHTREPRLFGSVSHAHLREQLSPHGIKFSQYEGPASFYNMLLSQAPARGIEMFSVVAEIPGYLQGLNPLSIEAVTRRLARILNLPIDLNALRHASDEWELQVTKAIEDDSELAQTIRKLEEEYDNQLIAPEQS